MITEEQLNEVRNDPDYQKLSSKEKLKVISGIFSDNIDNDPEFQTAHAQDPQLRNKVWGNFYKQMVSDPSMDREVGGGEQAVPGIEGSGLGEGQSPEGKRNMAIAGVLGAGGAIGGLAAAPAVAAAGRGLVRKGIKAAGKGLLWAKENPASALIAAEGARQILPSSVSRAYKLSEGLLGK